MPGSERRTGRRGSAGPMCDAKWAIWRATLAVCVMLIVSLGAIGTAAPAPQGERHIKALHRIYLSVHGLDWVGVTPDDPRRQTPRWEQWPGRCALIHPLDFEYRLRIYQVIRSARPDEGLMVLPSGNPHNQAMIDYAKGYFGDRMVVCDFPFGPISWQEVLGPQFIEGIEQDRETAQGFRPQGVSDEAFSHGFEAWVRAKVWATNLRQKLERSGYTFDPATVQFVAWGGDWRGCAATYPIHMGRALKLANPVERRWDLIIHDSGPMDVKSSLVVQNVVMPDNLRLFIYKTEGGRYCAEYWQGLYSPMEWPRQVTVEFPRASVRLVDRFGRQVGSRTYGTVTVPAGCGGHTPYRPAILQAGDGLTLDEFYDGLVAGKVSQRR